MCPIFQSLRRRGGGLRLLLVRRAVPADDCCCAWAGGARRRLLLCLGGTILNREAIQNLGCTGREVVPNFPVAAPPWWRLAPFVGAAGGARRRLLPRLGGRCPQTIAAALGRDDFESGSDSKSRLYREGGCAQFSSRCAAVVAACAFCWCGGRCSLTIAAAFGRAVPADDCCRTWSGRF